MTTAEKVGDLETGWPLLNRTSPSPIGDHPLPPRPPPQNLPSQSKENMSGMTSTIKRRPVGSATQPNALQDQPLSPVKNNGRDRSPPVIERKASFEVGDDMYMRQPQQPSIEKTSSPYEQSSEFTSRSSGPPPITQVIPYRQRQTVEVPQILHEPQSAVISSVNDSAPSSRHVSYEAADRRSTSGESILPQTLQYHHQLFDSGNKRVSAGSSTSSSKLRQTSGEQRVASAGQGPRMPGGHAFLGADLARPASAAYSSGSEGPNRTLSPGRVSNGRTPSPSRYSEHRLSYVDLLNVPYPQPPPASSSLDDAHLRSSVGQNVSMLGTKKTLEMYRQNAKKTNDPTIQYEFAVWMVNSAQEMATAEGINIHSKVPHHGNAKDESSSSSPAELLREARHILQRLSDRSYPYAQYYLADGYASGLFAKGQPDNDHAFPLFTSAAKHGHAEAGYRAALSYEFGWGCRKDFQKAVQYFRQSASKNHPGAMSRLGRACLVGDLGLSNRHREGLKWLKRAAESADFQYNSAPYELGLLHETGYGDDIFRDEAYAAQLFTQSADLGHAEANYRLGDAYEHGKLSCPKDPALSVHFYTAAAQNGQPLAMMALCAWYMVGAVPILEKDEAEAYEWAKRAADTGLPKAEYAVGYFTEMGIGTRRDPLEANVWYVRAADQGEERAKHRIAAIRAAASGGSDGGGGPRIGSKPDEASKGDKGDKRWKMF